MVHQVMALTWKDLKVVFKDRAALVTLFLMPFAFIVLMSLALGGSFQPSQDRPVRLLAVNEDRGSQAAALLRQLDDLPAFAVEGTWEGQPLTHWEAERLVAQGKRSLALVFPPDFSEVLEQASTEQRRRTTQVQAVADPAASIQVIGPILGTLQGLLERATFTAMAPKGIDLLFETLGLQLPLDQQQAFKAQAQRAMSGGLVGGQQPPVSVERTAPAGMRVQRFPDAFQQNVPGYTIFGIFWIVALLGSSVLQEKREGTFRRLLVAPMPRGALLAGKLVPYYLIALLQIAVMLAAARLLFGMNLGPSLAGLVVVSLAAAAAATGLGVLVAGIARTEAQINGMGTLLLLVLSALGGSFIPRFVMPEWMRTAGLATPHAWALDAYQDLLVRGYGLVEILPRVGVLAAFATVFFAVGVWRFRFE